jgi:hypothetical protein
MSRSNSSGADQTTLALTEGAHKKLTAMKDDGHFAEMRDAYRLAIGVAMRAGQLAPRDQKRSRTYLNAGSLDPDGLLRDVVQETFAAEGQPYEVIERLAEAGISILYEELSLSGEVTRFLRDR